MRKKIIGASVVLVVLAMLCIQPVAAQAVTVYAWTDKPWYNPGEKGKLKISVLNTLDGPISIRNISITYPWKVYDASIDKWVGNETIKIEPSATIPEKGGNYDKEVNFEIPNDGRATTGPISIDVGTSDGKKSPLPPPVIYVAGTGGSVLPTLIVGLDMWMTSLMVVVVVCTIILAIVVFLSTRGMRARGVVAPPPPKAKAE